MAATGPIVPTWTVGVSLSMALLAPFLPAWIGAVATALGRPTGADSHGLVGIVYVAGAIALLVAWLPLGVTLLVMRRRAASHPPRPLVLVVCATIAAAAGLVVLVDVLEAHIWDTAEVAYLATAILALGAAALAGAMAWRLRGAAAHPGPAARA